MATDHRRQQALALFQQQRYAEAKRVFHEICRIDESDFESWCYLGMLHAMEGEPDLAEQCLLRSVAIQPNSAIAHYNLARLREAKRDYAGAVEGYEQALRLRPDLFEACFNLGGVLRWMGRFSDARSVFERALRMRPNEARVHSAIASALLGRGEPREAAEACVRALALQPQDMRTRSLLLFISLLYRDDGRGLADLHREWQTYCGGEPALGWWPRVAQDPDRRLRIGYVSPNFYQHSVAYFFEPLLSHHDRGEFEIYCYADVDRPDATTDRLKEMATAWRDLRGRSDEEAVAQILEDRIDILVDLAGHTTGNRLPVFMRKPAPLQVEYIGYLHSTGIERIDYRISDQWADPEGAADELSAETIIRLPHGYLCYQPPRGAPQTAPASCLERDYVSFGSFNHLSKTSDGCVECWARLLGEVPGSRLVLKNESFLDPSVKQEWKSRFAASGVDPGRLQFFGIARSTEEHLGMYAMVDLALDTFPYNGTTTTCEALWMGVPVVTFAGRTHAGCQGASLLSQVGLGDLVAESVDGYRRIAAGLARDRRRLASLREGLRARVAASPLCDGHTVAREVEGGYRAIWKRWCEKHRGVSG